MNNIKIVFFVFLVTSLSAQKKENDWQKGKLKGKVESVIGFITTNIGVKEEITERTHINSVTQIFNKQGNLIRKGTFLDLEQVYMDEIYTYDSKNRLIENLSYWTKLNHRQKKEYVYENKLIIERGFKNNNFFAKYVSELDDLGNVLKKTSFNQSGAKVKTLFFEYKDGNLVKEKNKDYLKKRSNSKVNIYNGKGYLVEERGFYKGSPLYEIFFKYNKQGDVVEEKRVTGKDIAVMTYTYKYDKKDNYIEKVEVDVTNQMKRITKRKINYF